jgi:hypothetical protein
VLDRGDSPYACGGSGFADSAWNLARALAPAPPGESARGAALRRYLIRAAETLAERRLAEGPEQISKRDIRYHTALWKVRGIGAELSGPAPDDAPGLFSVLNAFAEAYRPGALLTFRPTGLTSVLVRDQMRALRDRIAALEEAELDPGDDLPAGLLVVRYPYGEHENTLAACAAIRFFHADGLSHSFATAQAGPAYFFAMAADRRDLRGLNESIETAMLCFVGELLESSGWLEHPQVGPLIAGWQDYFGFDAGYLDRLVASGPLRKLREAQETYRAATPAYTPADFDRDAPAMWDRLRQSEPPVAPPLDPRAGKASPAVVRILNAGWSFAQHSMDEFYAVLGCRTAADRYEARRAFNSLLATAIAQSPAGS